MPSLKPAMRYLFEILSQRHPWLEPAFVYNDEMFAMFVLAIEYSFLKKHDASFAENFYGLKREKHVPGRKGPGASPTNNGNSSLENAQRRSSLFFLVVVPYLKSKLDALYSQLEGPVTPMGRLFARTDTGHNESARTSSAGTTFRRMFTRVYPFVHAAYEGSLFLYQLLYLLEYTPFYTPWLNIQRLRIRRLTRTDMERIAHSESELRRRAETARSQGGRSLTGLLTRVAPAFHRAVDYTKYALVASVIVFRVLEWWYAAEQSTPMRSMPIPPPPDPPKPAAQGLRMPRDRRICPICERIRTNSTVASSGLVFCYPCIYRYVQEHNKCPVTFQPCSLDQLRKLYEADS